MVKFSRYTRPATEAELSDLLTGHGVIDVEPLDLYGDLAPMLALINKSIQSVDGGNSGPSLDAALVEAFHSTLRHIPRHIALDMRFWQWLAIACLPDLVWWRWYGSVPAAEAQIEIVGRSAGLRRHFLGSVTGRASLNAISRQALARLWWCGEVLRDPEASDGEQYGLARSMFLNSDLFVSVFERQMGLYPPLVRACARELSSCDGKVAQLRTRRLNHLLTTIAVETLDEMSIRALLCG